MTKLEEKLIELGYEKQYFPKGTLYTKRFKDFEFWIFVVDNKLIKKSLFSKYSGYEFHCIEKVVDEIKNDLKELELCQD